MMAIFGSHDAMLLLMVSFLLSLCHGFIGNGLLNLVTINPFIILYYVLCMLEHNREKSEHQVRNL